jgi:hypothetical protein
LLFYVLRRMYDVSLSSILWAVDVLMYSNMFYIQWHLLAKRIYGINKYMNMNMTVTGRCWLLESCSGFLVFVG